MHSLVVALALLALWVGFVGGVHLFVPVSALPTQAGRRYRVFGLVLVILVVVWVVVSNSVAQNDILP